MGHYDDVMQAFQLAGQARGLAAEAQEPLGPEDYRAFFAAAEPVDGSRTEREGGRPLQTVFLHSAYALRWRAEHADWVPFRHADIDLAEV